MESIGNYAFYDQDNPISSVTLGTGLKRIGECAFSYYYNSQPDRIEFKNTVGWSAGGNAISPESLSNATSAASKYDYYYDRTWTRTEPEADEAQ